MKADTYYGDRARKYDAARCHSLRWANEQRAVADMVFSGPVLDCPLGTGRYVSIYREKGLEVTGLDVSADMLVEAKTRYPDLDARSGSILDLPFEDGTFESAVCVRLLDWFYPEEMRRAVRELRRVARTLIVSIRYGKVGERVNYTHSLADFFSECQGLFICDRRVTEITRDGTEEIFRLRPPLWSDLKKQFFWHGHTPEFEAYRLAAEWAEPFGFEAPTISEEACRLRAEFWSDAELGSAIDIMAEHHPGYLTAQHPRAATDWPATILEHEGHKVILDGRRRINKWRQTPGLYPVLVVSPIARMQQGMP